VTFARSALLLLLVSLGCDGEHRARPPKIVLVPIGAVPAEVLTHLQRELAPLVKREITIANAIVPPAIDPVRQQYRGESLLAELSPHDIGEAERVVGIIDGDVYAPGLHFIFGQARKPGRFAVVALPRLRESFFGRPENEKRFRERVVKVTVHELGHTFGFAHCEDRKCVMHFARSLPEADVTGFHYCAREPLPK
jgi:archaemetzincin